MRDEKNKHKVYEEKMKTNTSTLSDTNSPKIRLPIILACSFIAILLTACARSGTQATPTPQPTPTTAAQGGMSTLPVARAKSFLADKLNINAETIQLVDAQAVQWPDTCLGVQTPGIMCAFHVVDGFKITLSADGQTYEMHTNLDGSQIVLVPENATVLITPTVAVTPTVVPQTAVPSTSVPPTAVLAPTTIPGAVRINFATGATAGTVEGELQPGKVQKFLVGALANQPLIVSTGSYNNDVTFSVSGLKDGKTLLAASQKLTSWQTMLTVTQDYLIQVYAGASTENFTLNVITPARINFEPGTVSVTETGTTSGGLVVSYILRANVNQQMDITLDAPNKDVLLSVYGYQDGQPYLRSAAGSQTFNRKLPATQDYVIQVVPNAGQVVSYTLNITIK